MTTETQTTTAAAGNITVEDVRAALNGLDPNATNASALRRALGRGSQTTIQKHLDVLRLELVAEPLDALGAAPDAPKELMQSIWAAAWTAAQARTAGALATAQQHAAQLVAALATAQADTAAAQAEADNAAQLLAAQQAESIQQSDQHIDALDAMQREVQDYVERVEALRQEMAAQAQQHAQEAAQAHQVQQLATVQAQAVEATLRGELDRQISQLADLRAALGNSSSVDNDSKNRKPKPEQGSII
jgi:DNA anti-recombination protein RmuC